MQSSPTRPAGAPATIERQLTREILQGVHAPGSLLPSVRRMADRFGVNASTVHRAVSRLEARGLVEAQHGRGLVVNDPSLAADLGFLADWLDALADEPSRAVDLLAELLELRRTTAARLVVRHRHDVLPLIEGIAAVVEPHPGWTADQAAATDLLVTRSIVERTGEMVARSLLNSWERAIREQPDLLPAAYAEPERNARTFSEMLDAVRAGGPDLAARIESAYVAIDDLTLSVYEERLRARLRRDAVVPG